MRATPPQIEVPGDNAELLLLEEGNPVSEREVRPRIMQRSGECLGMTPTHAVWRFGFAPGSEDARAYGVQLDGEGFLWVLATRKTGMTVLTFQGWATDLPPVFHEVIDS